MLQPLPVAYHRQRADGYCLAACAQMALDYWGIAADQEALARQLGVEPGVGAPARRIERLGSPDLAVIYESGEWDIVPAWLAGNTPLIAMIQAGELPHWQGDCFQHAVMVVGCDASQVWLLDPAARPDPLAVSIDEFMLAWGEMDYRYAAVALSTMKADNFLL
jgi:ABC-type bacteriocin/lantibiotic exporter with double-glycine peptidase domain